MVNDLVNTQFSIDSIENVEARKMAIKSFENPIREEPFQTPEDYPACKILI